MSDDKHGPQPSLRPTAPSTISVCAIASGAVTMLLVARYYQQVPDLAWYNSAAILALAVLLAWLAWNTRRTLRPSDAREARATPAGRRETPDGATGAVRSPEHAIQIARFAVLAKAAAIGGALCFGAYMGFTAWLAVQSDRLQAAANDLPGAIIGSLACAALTAAALWLEHSCRIPPSPGEDERPPD
jgi:hypothetical protein